MNETLITPIDIFSLLKYVPFLIRDFREECYRVPDVDSLDYTTDSEKKYDHNLGIAFLKRHGIPTTKEELHEDKRYIYESVMTGDTRYNVGQFIVLFSNTIYGSGDITKDNTWVVEVMDEFEFPSNQPLISMSVESIKLALKEHLDRGIIKLHNTGIRMYSCNQDYEFAIRMNKEVKDAESQ